jgi:hypothetical protein
MVWGEIGVSVFDAQPALFVIGSATTAGLLYEEPSAGGLALRTLSALLGTDEPSRIMRARDFIPLVR